MGAKPISDQEKLANQELANLIDDFSIHYLLPPHQLVLQNDSFKEFFLKSPQFKLYFDMDDIPQWIPAYVQPNLEAIKRINLLLKHPSLDAQAKNTANHANILKTPSLQDQLLHLRKTYRRFLEYISSANLNDRLIALDTERVFLPGMKKVFQIPKELPYYLLSTDEYGFITKSNHYGSSPIRPYRRLYIKRSIDKFAPFQEGRTYNIVPSFLLETSVRSFFELLSGSGHITPSDLIIFEGIPHIVPTEGSQIYKKFHQSISDNFKPGNPTIGQMLVTSPEECKNFEKKYGKYFVQVSREISGPLLGDWLKSHYSKPGVNSNSLKNFSEMFTVSALLSFIDASYVNFIVEGSNIVGFDNDMIFGEEVLRGRGGSSHYMGCKNIFYCMHDYMNAPFDPAFRSKILETDPHVLLLKWLDAHEKTLESYRYLRDAGFITKEEHEFYNLEIAFDLNKINSIIGYYKVLREALGEKSHITHQEILERLKPTTAMYYKTMRDRYPSSEEAFKSIYQSNSPSIEKLLGKNFVPLNSELLKYETKEASQGGIFELTKATDLNQFSDVEKIAYIETLAALYPKVQEKDLHPSWKSPTILSKAIELQASMNALGLISRVTSWNFNLPDDRGYKLVYYIDRFGQDAKDRLLSFFVRKGLVLSQEEKAKFSKKGISLQEITWNHLHSDLRSEILSHFLQQRFAAPEQARDQIIKIRSLSKGIKEKFPEISNIAVRANWEIGTKTGNFQGLYLGNLRLNSGSNLQDLDFRSAYMPMFNAQKCHFINVNFTKAYMPYSTIQGSRLEDVTFDDSDISWIDASSTAFTPTTNYEKRHGAMRALFKKYNITVDLNDSIMMDVITRLDSVKECINQGTPFLNGTKLEYLSKVLDLDKLDKKDSDAIINSLSLEPIPDVVIQSGSFKKAKMIYANFENAGLLNINFEGAQASHANFKGSSIGPSTGLKPTMRRADFSNCDFTHATIKNVGGTKTNFLNTNFSWAQVSDSDFRFAIFDGAAFYTFEIKGKKEKKEIKDPKSKAKIENCTFTLEGIEKEKISKGQKRNNTILQ